MLTPRMRSRASRIGVGCALLAAILGAANHARAAAPQAPPSVLELAPVLAEIVNIPVFSAAGHLVSPGDLTQSHASFDTTGNCVKCHVQGKNERVENALCWQAGCHDADIGKHQADKKHFHGSRLVLSKTCGQCHDDHRGLTFDIVNDKKAKAQIGGVTNPASAWGVAMQTVDGAETAWAEKNWDHDLTGYKLVGGHKIACDKCHKTTITRPKTGRRSWLTLKSGDKECLSCHANYHNFPAGDKFEECLLCHTFNSWKKEFNLQFDHDKTEFPLRGAHNTKVTCDKCHAKGKPFKPVPHETCETCHLADSVHGKTFTTRQCIVCHNETSWKQIKVSTRDHKSFAKYDARGAHGRLSCGSCHKQVKSTPSAQGAAEGVCTACHNNIHSDQWMKGTKVCTKCHTEEQWRQVTVKSEDHRQWSSWNLTANKEQAKESKHMQLQCIACHPDLGGIPEKHECIYCHVDFHLKIDKSSKGQRCDQCHDTRGWGATSFDHNKKFPSGAFFPLMGAHTTVLCEDCHTSMKTTPEGQTPNFKLDKKCEACHKSVHLGKLPDNCEKCHNTTDWKPADGFDHNRDSKFKLSGRHQQVGCYVCHLDLGFKGTPLTCNECHSDYHKGAWGSAGCQECHNEKRWQLEKGLLVFQSLHNYGEVVLSGVHEKLKCEVCHDPQPRWLMSGFGGECNTCHPDVHLGSRGEECFRCHSQNAWLPAQFNHNTTGFPLYGVHRLVPCVECHKGNLYSGLPDECVFCHAEDGKLGHGTGLVSGNSGNLRCGDCHIPTTWRLHLTTPNP